MSVVLDASFLSRAIVRSQRLAVAADQLTTLLQTDVEMIAPYVLQAEFASALRSLDVRMRLEERERRESWGFFRNLPIDYRWDETWVDRALQIAEQANLSKVYDSVYLACAEAYGFSMLTCDARFARATSHPLIRLFA